MLELRDPEAPPAAGEAPTWTRKDLLDTDTLSADEIRLVMDTAEAMREIRARPVGKVATLRGATVITLFYEQSTRTRASFEVAAKALGADVVNLTASGSSVEKGETLIDTVRTLEAIGADLVVMRHPKSGAPYLAARNTAAGIINGGDGTHAHPTQALLDLFTMRRHVGDVAGKKVAIIGDVLHSRVARSNLWTLLASGANVTLCGPATLLPRTLASEYGEGARCTVTTNVEAALEDADIVMALRMQKERQDRGLIPSLREYITNYQVNTRRLNLAKPGALVMHPGPMNEGIEIAPEVAHGLASVIEEQVANGVAVRMAILYLMATREALVTENILLRGGRVVDPANGLDAVVDVLIADGAVRKVAAGIQAEARVLDVRGCVVAPGFIDLHTHLREPGFEQKGTIATETLAALRGGFTTVCAMPNTNPAPDAADVLRALLERIERDAHVRVLPIGCITRRREGKELAELSELAAGGCVALSDDGSPVSNPRLMRNAMELAKAMDIPISEHCDEPELSHGGSMHEGRVSERLGLAGQPEAAETTAIARNLALCEATGARLHIAHVTTARGLELVADAKRRGLRVTCEVTPSHLFLTHDAVFGAGPEPAYDSNAKINPPLRTETDRRALLAGVNSGIIDAIATDHAPHAIEDKLCEFDDAAFGISCIETALATVATLIERGELELAAAVRALTSGPASVLSFGAGAGTLSVGAADVTVFDPLHRWVVDPMRFASKGRNTPLGGVELTGMVRAVIYNGQLAYELEAAGA